MNLGISGSRCFNNYEIFKKYVDDFRKDLLKEGKEDVVKIIEGECPQGGIDALAKRYAIENKLELQPFPPQFNLYKGNKPYYMRNLQIVEACDFLLAFPGPTSTGTILTINIAKEKKKPYKVINVDK